MLYRFNVSHYYYISEGAELGKSDLARITGAAGSGTEFSVQNPYITVYMWKRIS